MVMKILEMIVVKWVSCEPGILEAECLHTQALAGDLKIVVLWEAGKSAFLDYRIVNPDAPSYASQDCFKPRKSTKNMIIL